MLILGLSAALAMLFMGFAIFGMRSGDAAEKRLSNLSGKSETVSSGAHRSVSRFDEGDSWQERLIRFITLLATKTGSADPENKVYDTVTKRLTEAGFRRASALSVYMGSRIALSGGLAMLVILVSLSMRSNPPVLVIGIAAAIGYIVPGMVVDNLRTKRQEEISRGLSDAIDLMVVCVEAGLGLGATLSRVADDFQANNKVIADEFQATVSETRAGRGMMDSLRGMAARNGNKELNLLVSLLVQTDRFGTPLVDTLRAQGAAMRIERMLRAEESAQRAPIKMMMPAGLIFFSILLILGAPAVMHISKAFN